MKKWIHILCSIILISSLSACSSKDQAFSKSAFYFDTQLTITIYSENAEELLEECMQICERMEKIFSRTRKDSELYAINHRNTDTLKISDDMKTVIEAGLHGYEISNHAFDITIAPLLEAWNFTQDNASVPNKDVITNALDYIGSEYIELNRNTLTIKNKNTQIDLGALAKGYIADVIKNYLLENEVKSGFINIGGNVLCIGSKPDGTSWNIGIQEPFKDKGEVLHTVKVEDISVASSGVYERHFIKNNINYHHLLDARSGYPMNNGLWQVTILTPSSLEADKLSSALFLMGLEEGMKYIESRKNCEAIFVDDKGKLHFSSGLK